MTQAKTKARLKYIGYQLLGMAICLTSLIVMLAMICGIGDIVSGFNAINGAA